MKTAELLRQLQQQNANSTNEATIENDFQSQRLAKNGGQHQIKQAANFQSPEDAECDIFESWFLSICFPDFSSFFVYLFFDYLI
jgi:hypothetical protein